MQPWVMLLLIAVAVGVFARTIVRRYKLMTIGPGVQRFDRVGERIRLLLRYGLGQARMPRYRWAGLAHAVIFFGFVVLLLRSLILFSRGFVEGSDLWLFSSHSLLGGAYSLIKDVFAVLVILGVLVFLYYRVVKKLPRMTLNNEGLLILGIIFVMMWADFLYDGAELARQARATGGQVGFSAVMPAGSLLGMALDGASPSVLRILQHVGFWTHVSLVLLFLNLLPISKHFHVITALPNVYTQRLYPMGRLAPVQDIEGRLEREEPLGVSRIGQFHWKSILDLYTCTECGRCSDHCPATRTGKLLSPKHLTIDLRNFLYEHEDTLVRTRGNKPASDAGEGGESGGDGAVDPHRVDLTAGVINPEVLWACTTCGACEQECPVFITYIDKIVDMRRSLVMERAEFPGDLQNMFRGLETSSNPWSFSPDQRGAWADGLNIPLFSDKPDAEYLFWVGCAPAFDDRSKRVTRATARLLQHAGVDFAILAEQEQCTGDPARRAGNEFLFQMLAQTNVETLNGLQVKKIVTTCPHCFNMLANEYPDFGGKYEVVHHTQLLSQLVASGRLKPQRTVDAEVVFHDSCYLGRHNGVYDPPRDIIRSIPGARLVEATQSRDRGMCCGAGGAQMFKEEEPGKNRVNYERTDQLLATGAKTISSACPFCMTMLTDGLKQKEPHDIQQLDVAELLWKSVEPEEQKA